MLWISGDQSGPLRIQEVPLSCVENPKFIKFLSVIFTLTPNQPRYVKVFEIHKHVLIFMDQCISKAWKVG